MRIRTNIFIWVFFATVVPLTGLMLGATYYSQNAYQQAVSHDVLSSLESISRELERHLRDNQELVQGMARAPAVQGFVPVLAGQASGRLPEHSARLRAQVNRYFEGFQTILPGTFYLRLLDVKGNSLVKVSHNNRSDPTYESLSGLDYVEQEIASEKFVTRLRELAPDQAHALDLPHNRLNEMLEFNFTLLDYVVPLYQDDQWVGALAVTLGGRHLDRILDNASRLYQGELFVVENNPDKPRRHGRILYDKSSDIRFAQIRAETVFAGDKYDDQMLTEVVDSTRGLYRSEDERFHNYYVELTPYPDRLISWVLTSHIDSSVIFSPYSVILIGIGLFGIAALIITLLLSDIGVRKVAQPVCRLAGRIKAYANGDHTQRAEEKQAIDEIGALAQAFNYLADTLDTAREQRDRAEHMMLQSNKLASIGQMAAGIGHEINNPLNNVLSYTKLLQRTLQKVEYDEPQTRQRVQTDLDALRDEALRASDIVRGILNFARQVPPQYSHFDVQPWLENTLALVRQAARGRHVQLDLQCDFAGELEGDRSQLQQALINLLLNAIQASPPDGRVLIRCQRQATRLILTIRDEGEGIAPEKLDNIFDPFFSTKAEGEGSGLGLSISLGIIEFHNGALTIENNPDGGVTATVVLPLQADSANQERVAND
ncbi:sensor histidine kinase [Thiohalophilus thiocyanatoxydans]|uniref:histidine kinase n=1 Tax=Thiohalophilus thiocyanatoxydans TaxID=381308 RepID=A0A4R8IU69_9GAMM|nr:ATP-binding protein [Thiohalophilus thiocyanatoxydans]TDY03984.1 two-component system NtrC family sensor kinase [Thiohalophilus thiocyanatoxydans]